MLYKEIDFKNFKRAEHFKHFTENNPCSYSLTVNVDITAFLIKLKYSNFKFYPSIIYAISNSVNQIDEMKTALYNNKLVLFDKVEPCFTVLNKQTGLFSSVFTEFNDDFNVFYKICAEKADKYSLQDKLMPETIPENCFYISALPWVSFTSFNLNIMKSSDFFLPIFTIGKYFENGKQTLLPIAIQIHHAVCDGFHIGLFIEKLQNFLNC